MVAGVSVAKVNATLSTVGDEHDDRERPSRKKGKEKEKIL